MMATVTAVLADLGLLEAGQIPRYHIGLTKGDTIWVDAFIGRGVFFHIKIAEFIALDGEARAYNEAWSAYHDFMPRPLGYCARDGLEIFVAEGVEHRPFCSGSLFVNSGPRIPFHSVHDFFEASAQQTLPAQSPQAHLSLLQKLEARFKDSMFAQIVARWSSGAEQRELEALREIPQHGDFVLNNLGVTGSRLVIFDWEDFGKVALPGLDLCTLVVSSTAADTDFTGALITGRHPLAARYSSIVEPACKALGIEVAQFRRLVPLYLLAFLYLKQGYATEVRQRIARILRQLCAEVRRRE